MRQYAWLDFHGGCWHPVTSNASDRDRKRANRQAALSDLITEGWIIDGPHGKQPTTMDFPNQHFCGYGLRRTVH